MIKNKLIIIACFFLTCSYAQQYPWWSQYSGNQLLFNPAFCGTKRIIDFRLNYRNQWVGYDGSPKTYVLSLNGRLARGRIGLGAFMFKDVIGPFENSLAGLTFAYHLKFADSEFSVGGQLNYMQQKFNGSDITIRNQQDKSINQYVSDKATRYDGSFGLLYFNDRFHVGLATNNLASSVFEYYKNDSLKKGKYTNEPHYHLSAGFNWADNPDFVFENSLLAAFIPGVPLTFDYTLRVHIQKQLIAGASFVVGDAIVLHLGYTIKENYQISYSYDIVTSSMRRYQKGSHELKFIFSSNLGSNKTKRGLNGRFLKQRFQYLL